jgi:di/tricarboxylate transporter
VASVVIFASAVLFSLLGLPIFLAVLAAALLAIIAGFISLHEAYRSVEWEIVFFVAGMHAASLAMINTGLASLVGQRAVGALGGLGPLAVAASAFLATAALTQLMGGQATSFVVGPIAISTAIQLQVNPQAIAVAAALGCSAAFLTPVAHPVNLIVMGPGNHRFGDFSRVGAPLMALTFVALLVGMSLFWHL